MSKFIYFRLIVVFSEQKKMFWDEKMNDGIDKLNEVSFTHLKFPILRRIIQK